MKKIIIGIFVALLVIVGIFYFIKFYIWEDCCSLDENVSLPVNICQEREGVWYEETKVCEVNQLSKDECELQGGEFNGCNSACRHNPEAEVCTMQCVVTCSFR